MNPRRVMTWGIFWSSVALALGALAWVSVEVVALERREARTRAQAARQETIRRALWRMDSRMAPILAIEASRPSEDYKALDGVDAQWLRSQMSPDASQTTLGAPLLPSGDSYANMYFELEQGGDSAKTDDPDTQRQISSLINRSLDTENAAKSGEAFVSSLVTSRDARPASAPAPQRTQAKDKEEAKARGLAYGQEQESDSDYQARRKVAEIASQTPPVSDRGQTPLDSQAMTLDDQADQMGLKFDIEQTQSGSGLAFARLYDLSAQGAMAAEALGSSTQLARTSATTLEPRWVQDDAGDMQLVLVRSAVVDARPVVQGVWLNWPALSTDLLESVDDVLPGAALAPVRPASSAPVSVYQLATIPVALIPPVSQAAIPWSWSPATVGLLVTWIAIIATIVAVGLVLRAAIVLSQRRGHFVSAVTHELRTPLTTFRLYAQMLADGMVSDEQVRSDYLATLKRESERLTGIVENVLEYARLTRQRSSKAKPAGVQTLSPGALVARFRPALARRVGQSNLDLVVSLDLESHQERTVTLDPHAVERIMMNLVENACKYAAPAEDDAAGVEDFDTRIHLDVGVSGETLELLVADHGPGIAPSERARIFGEFQRGRRGLTNARSGLGLGLALSRGLAREMGGELQIARRRGHGAEFLLTVPLDSRDPHE